MIKLWKSQQKSGPNLAGLVLYQHSSLLGNNSRKWYQSFDVSMNRCVLKSQQRPTSRDILRIGSAYMLVLLSAKNIIIEHKPSNFSATLSVSVSPFFSSSENNLLAATCRVPDADEEPAQISIALPCEDV
eukprot:scaffold5326_cov191-Amphora_coffeaeformis.AAC.1